MWPRDDPPLCFRHYFWQPRARRPRAQCAGGPRRRESSRESRRAAPPATRSPRLPALRCPRARRARASAAAWARAQRRLRDYRRVFFGEIRRSAERGHRALVERCGRRRPLPRCGALRCRGRIARNHVPRAAQRAEVPPSREGASHARWGAAPEAHDLPDRRGTSLTTSTPSPPPQSALAPRSRGESLFAQSARPFAPRRAQRGVGVPPPARQAGTARRHAITRPSSRARGLHFGARLGDIRDFDSRALHGHDERSRERSRFRERRARRRRDLGRAHQRLDRARAQPLLTSGLRRRAIGP